MNEYLKRFKNALDNGASDNELEKIIDEAADNLEDDEEYSNFYEAVTAMIRR